MLILVHFLIWTDIVVRYENKTKIPERILNLWILFYSVNLLSTLRVNIGLKIFRQIINIFGGLKLSETRKKSKERKKGKIIESSNEKIQWKWTN